MKGDEELRAALRRLNPRENPAMTRRYFNSAGRLLRDRIRGRLEGPRPTLLDKITGELWRSIGWDFGADFAEAGTDLWWLELYEVGLGRFRQRAAVLPALEGALGELETLLAREWEGAL